MQEGFSMVIPRQNCQAVRSTEYFCDGMIQFKLTTEDNEVSKKLMLSKFSYYALSIESNISITKKKKKKKKL